ncbi:hypothetical protein QAD02_002523 [Eretmocerus hayati]|uniref:Uncharacterized protein n=1 Tax=Eretmocerus hayati TaxID=131215 RepID=A0ACC2NJF3_9HYME|nr:hypothetical protein QAD02_002523 [Eretmocerus hayati]
MTLPLTHDAHRERVCCWCLKRIDKNRKLCKIFPKSKIEALVNKLVDYRASDPKLPCVICDVCKTQLYRRKGNPEIQVSKPDYSKFVPIKMSLRSSEVCVCRLCGIGRYQGMYNFAYEDPHGVELRKDGIHANKSEMRISFIEKECAKCLSIIGRGLSHECTESTRIRNLKDLLSSSSGRSRGIVVSSKLRELADKRDETTSKSAVSLSTFGRPMRVCIDPKPFTQSSGLIPADVMVNIKNNHNLSKKTTLGIVSNIRSVTGKRNVVGTGVKSKLNLAIHSLDGFFSVEKFTFTQEKDGSSSEIELKAVHCHDLKGLIEFVKRERGVLNVLLEIGVDGGRGSLKICFSIQDSCDSDKNSLGTSSAKKFKRNSTSKRFLDSGVKKLFIIGLVES